jgi:hypothetical protein
MEANGQTQAPAALPPGERVSGTNLISKLGTHKSRFERSGENRTSKVQTLANPFLTQLSLLMKKIQRLLRKLIPLAITVVHLKFQEK